MSSRGGDDPTKFVMIEHWSSVEAHQKHFDKNVKGAGVLDSAEALMPGRSRRHMSRITSFARPALEAAGLRE
jgi:hypothetical protein